MPSDARIALLYAAGHSPDPDSHHSHSPATLQRYIPDAEARWALSSTVRSPIRGDPPMGFPSVAVLAYFMIAPLPVLASKVHDVRARPETRRRFAARVSAMADARLRGQRADGPGDARPGARLLLGRRHAQPVVWPRTKRPLLTPCCV